MINLSQIQTLQQRLSPQQMQYLKLLQLPVLALEQSIKAELEQNPLLEEVDDLETLAEEEPALALQSEDEKPREETEDESGAAESAVEDDYPYEELIREDAAYKTQEAKEEDREEFQNAAPVTLTESLLQQLPLLNLTPVEQIIGEEIIGNIDPDGYLRRRIKDIVGDLNRSIVLHSNGQADAEAHSALTTANGNGVAGSRGNHAPVQIHDDNGAAPTVHGDSHAPIFDTTTAERVLTKIQHLEPVGIASRDLRECLTVQLHAIPRRNIAQELALRILNECFDTFVVKHYDDLRKQLGTTEEALRAALEEIQKLNPKPGNNSFGAAVQTVVPDFLVERTENDDLIISLNDSTMPQIRINAEYKAMLDHGRKTLPRDTRVFLRQKFDSAKLFITSLQQRRMTMMATMRAIAELQQEFFLEGKHALKPIFYRHVAERVGLDVSTICRVANGKYVQCDWGIFELRYFFNDSISTFEGDEVANRVMKTRVKEMIAQENKRNPLSDEEMAQKLQSEGFNIARRTIAKYREAQGIPVARLRKELK